MVGRWRTFPAILNWLFVWCVGSLVYREYPVATNPSGRPETKHEFAVTWLFYGVTVGLFHRHSASILCRHIRALFRPNVYCLLLGIVLTEQVWRRFSLRSGFSVSSAFVVGLDFLRRLANRCPAVCDVTIKQILYDDVTIDFILCVTSYLWGINVNFFGNFGNCVDDVIITNRAVTQG